MTNATVRVVRAEHPGNSLAIWLGLHHPDLFVATVRAARAAQGGKKVRTALGRLADDYTLPIDSSFVPAMETFDPGSVSLPDNLISDSFGGGGDLLDSIGSGFTSAGTTVMGAIGGGFSGMLSAIGQAGTYLTSASGLKTLASLGQSYFQSQAASSNAQNAQTSAAVLQSQIARTATNQPAAPITYTTSNGQLVPVYASSTPQGPVYQPLTPQGLASLTPSSLSVFLAQYGMYLLVAGVAVVAIVALRR